MYLILPDAHLGELNFVMTVKTVFDDTRIFIGFKMPELIEWK